MRDSCWSTAASRVDVLDQDGARPAAVRLPQLTAVGAVVGGEEQPTPDGGQGGGTAAGRPRGVRLMFLTRTVPALVPSDFHSSRPWVPSLAAKNNRPPMAVREEGWLPAVRRAFGLMFLTRTVPALLPSDFHSSRPVGAVVAEKNKRPAHRGQVRRDRCRGSGDVVDWVDVLDQDRARPACRPTSTALGRGCRRRR